MIQYIMHIHNRFQSTYTCILYGPQGIASLKNNCKFKHLNLSECAEVSDIGIEVSDLVFNCDYTRCIVLLSY